jgi:drug/metabolite transporter (DMT)-like permease
LNSQPTRPQVAMAVSQAVLASFIWGFAFIALRWSVGSLGPLWVSALRFLVAFVILLPFAWIVPRWRAALTMEQCRLGFVAGLTLGISLLLQAAGLLYTPVTRAGFITVLYVVFTPIIEGLVLKRSLPWRHWLWVALAVAGSALLCGWRPDQWNVGDLLTLGCAVFAAAHLVVLQHIAPRVKSSCVMNGWQSLWAGVCLLPIALVFEAFPAKAWSFEATAGFAYLVLVSTLIGFLLQMMAQRVLRSSTACLILLMESPWAAMFAWVLLGERLTVIQAVGCALILLAAAGATRGAGAEGRMV